MQHVQVINALKISNLKFQIFNLKFLITLCLFLIPHLPSYGMTLPPEQTESGISECDLQEVSRVIDGDTFVLSDGNRVRLIGVDAPETVDPRKDVQWFGREASKKLRGWINGKTVCLKEDIDKTQDIDKYGRLLRYVWIYNTEKPPSGNIGLVEGFFVNAELIKQGYAFAYTRYPFQYLEDFRRYERKARENNLGLWNKEKYAPWQDEVRRNEAAAKTCGREETICPEEAVNHIGEHKTVRFFVKKSYDSGRAVFLNSKNDFNDPDNFTAVIFEKDKYKFPASPADHYWGKTVNVTGIIKEYEGRAEIILEKPSQIKIVD